MIPLYAAQKDSMFVGFGNTIFGNPVAGKERPTIFGYDQIKGRRPNSAGCCRDLSDGSSNGASKLVAFYPTIWKYPLRNILIVNDSLGGESKSYPCCDNLS